MIDHDAAMRIADVWTRENYTIGPGDTLLRDLNLLARAYKDVVRDALTPEEALAVVGGEFYEGNWTREDERAQAAGLAKLRRIAARAATTKEAEGE